MLTHRLLRCALALVLMASGLSGLAAEQATYQVVPLPQQVSLLPGKQPFVLDAGITVNDLTGGQLSGEAQFLRDYIAQTTGLHLAVGGKRHRRAITLSLGLKSQHADAYQVVVGPKAIEVRGTTAAAVFWAVQLLRKSLALVRQGSHVEFPAAVITDYPRFGYRGAHLDVCRHFYTVEQVEQFIDMLAMHNINEFHWHLTDDQGWRLEIKKYPRLTQVGAWREHTVIGRNSGRYDGKPHGGFYTQDQARQVVAYAAKRHIEVIPEIEMPGHALAALAAYPQLGCTGGPFKVWGQWGVADDVLCAGNDSTYRFISDVLAEVMDIFPSRIIDIGGDECPKVRWRQCPKCQARIRAEHLVADSLSSAEDKLQGLITHYASQVLTSHGRSPMGWDEILQADVPPEAIVMSWRGTQGGIDGARRGHRVVMTANSALYFDYYQSTDVKHEPFAIGGYIPVKKVYDFEPVPAELDSAQQRLILGAQCNLWTEYITTFSHVQYMELPRMAALSEVQWTLPDKKNYADFKRRLPVMLRLYDRCGYNYARHILTEP